MTVSSAIECKLVTSGVEGREEDEGKGFFFFGSVLLGSSPGRSALQSAK